jgi:hypothetical protein
MKKAQGMSLNVIVIAAIVILILIVLSVIFIRGSGTFVERVASCEVKGGMCAAECGSFVYGTQDHTIRDFNARCSNGLVCCLKVGN